MWGCEDVSMSGCEDVRRWRCEDVRMWRCEHVWQTPTIRRTLRSEALGNNMSFDSDCLSGASPGANPLWGQKKAWNRGYMTFNSRQLSFIIISIAIHHRHRHRHHHCRRHHHHHHHFSCVLSSRLLPPAFFHATLSSSVFIHVRVLYQVLKQN